MSKHRWIAAGYAVLLPVTSTILVILVAAGVEGAVAGARRRGHR